MAKRSEREKNMGATRAKAGGVGPSLPLESDDVDGVYVLTKSLQEEVKQNLKHLLLTCPEERCMYIDFGVCIRNYLFEPNTAETYDKIYASIIAQTKKYMDYITIDNVVFNDGKKAVDENALAITIMFTIVPISISDILSLPFGFTDPGASSYEPDYS